MFTNGQSMDLPRWAKVKKTFYVVEIHWLSSEEKIPDAAVSKEGHTDGFVGYEKTHHYMYMLYNM